MKGVRATLLALALAGCADSGIFESRKTGRACDSDRTSLAADEACSAQGPNGEGRSI